MCIKNVQRFADVLSILVHLVERLSLKTLLMLKVQKSLICLMGTRKPTVSIVEKQLSNLFSKTLT
jgi:hypothetical protein